MCVLKQSRRMSTKCDSSGHLISILTAFKHNAFYLSWFRIFGSHWNKYTSVLDKTFVICTFNLSFDFITSLIGKIGHFIKIISLVFLYCVLRHWFSSIFGKSNQFFSEKYNSIEQKPFRIYRTSKFEIMTHFNVSNRIEWFIY